MAYTVEKLVVINMAMELIANKEIQGVSSIEQKDLYSAIESLITSEIENFSPTEQLKTIKAALESS